MNKFRPVIFFIFISFFVLILNAFPNYYAYINTPPGKVFTGQASWFDPWDINVYVSAIKWGQGGNVLLQNNYTTAEHTSVLMYPFYTSTGYLLSSVPPYMLFHISAVVSGLILLLVLWRLVKVYIPNVNESLAALFLIALGGGIGWLFFPNFQSSDLFITGFTFTSHFQRPHEALGITLYLLSLVLFYLAASTGKFRFNILSFVSLLTLIFFYPYYFLSYVLICAIYALSIYLKRTDKRPLIYVFLNTSLLLPVILIYLNHLQGSTGFSGVISQQLGKPDILHLISGYGILTAFLIYQVIYLKKDKVITFLNIWFFGSLFLSFLPFGFSRFYLRTLFFPAILLTLFSLKSISSRLHISRKILITVLIAVLPFSSFYIATRRLTEIENKNPWYYITQAERETFDFLKTQTQKGSGILSAYAMGNLIPANTDNKVYFGHLLQTPDAREKIKNLANFYSSALTEEEALEFLKREKINYVYLGSEERNSLNDSKSNKLNYRFLKPVFTGDTTIFSY